MQSTFSSVTAESKDHSQNDDAVRKKYALLNMNINAQATQRIFSTGAIKCTTFQKQSYAAFNVEGNKIQNGNRRMGRIVATRLWEDRCVPVLTLVLL